MNADSHNLANCYDRENEAVENKAAFQKHGQTDMGRLSKMLQKWDTQMRQAEAR